MESWVKEWFKPLAYACILLRQEGIPCIFYGDYYGISHDDIEPMNSLKTLLLLRKDKAYGEQIDYFDNPDIIGFTRLGDEEHNKSGLAVIISDKNDGSKRMYVGRDLEGSLFIDALDNRKDEVYIDEDGFGNFPVSGGTVSVYVRVE